MVEKTSTERSKDLYAALKADNLLDYGTAIKSDYVCNIIGIAYPLNGTKAVYDKLSLIEMSAVDYVRNILLDEGKYFTQVKGDYRILLPSENAKQIGSYILSAGNKMSRASRLLDSMPEGTFPQQHHIATRLLMKQDSLKAMKLKNGQTPPVDT